MGANPQNISASRGGAVLGLSKWATPLDVWIKIMGEHNPAVLEKHGLEVPPREDKALFRWGHAFESAIIRIAEIEAGQDISAREQFFEIEDKPYITCHIDGHYASTDGTLHEGKTVFERAFNAEWGEPGTDHVKDVYQIQCQHQMACTGADKVILSALVFPKIVDEWEAAGTVATLMDNKYSDPFWVLKTEFGDVDPLVWAMQLRDMGYFKQYFIYRDEELIEKMIDQYDNWWNEYVVGENLPPAQTMNDVKNLITSPVGTIVASPKIERISALDKALAEEIRNAEKKRKEYKLAIAKFMHQNLEGAALDDDSREKLLLMDQSGRKIRSMSKKGVLR